MVFKPHAYAWEKEYKRKGGLWRGYSQVPLLVEKGRVLELGCGNGKTLIPLAKAGLDVWGVDVAPSGLKLAESALDEHLATAHLVEADACSLPFEARFFDAAYTVHVLDHLSDQEREQAVRELYRVMKPGALAWFECFAKGDAREGKGLQVEDSTFRKGTNVWCHFFALEEARALFEKNGFTAVRLSASDRPERYGRVCLERKTINGLFKRL